VPLKFTMKISKVFGFVLSVHVGVIAVLIVQPGCGTTQSPTPSFEQTSTLSSSKVQSTSYTPSQSMPRPSLQSTSRPVSSDPAISNSRTIRTIPRQDTGRFVPAVRSSDTNYDSFSVSNSSGTSERSAPRRPSSDADAFNAIPVLRAVPSTRQVEEVQTTVTPEPALTVDFAGPSTQEYVVEKGDNLWSIAKRKKVPLNDLYKANGLNKNSVLRIGQTLKIPVEGSSASVMTVTADTYQPSSYNMETKTYTVRGGDSLSEIAVKQGSSVRAIKAANSKSSDVIRIGEKLIIPVGDTTARPPSTPSPKPMTSREVPEAMLRTGSGETGTHTVKAGEIPGVIARKYGMNSAELLALNGIDDPRTLQVGQVLKIQSATSATSIQPRSSSNNVQSSAPVVPAAGSGPVVIESVKTTYAAPTGSEEIDVDALFENAVEIPVIRLDE